MRVGRVVLLAVFGSLVTTSSAGVLAQTAPAPNVVTEWSRIVQPAIHSAAEPRSPVGAFIVHTLVHLAVYDAVMAIEGGFEPFRTTLDAPGGADVRAAVATAAYRSARGRVAPSQHAYLDEKYTAYLAAIPEGKAKQDGVAVGEATAAGMLAARQNDNFSNNATYACSADPPPVGEFVPEGGCGTQPNDVKTAQVVPYTFTNPAQFRPGGPPALTSERWATDFEETKTLGRKDSAVRTPEQTDVVYFWSEHTYVQWHRNLNEIAISRNLGVRDTARFLAMTFTSVSDAGIAGFEAKYHYRARRPRTAVPGAEGDGNAATAPDATWTPLLSVNHPEYPSGHSFVTGAITEAMRTFFGTDQVEVSLDANKATIPQLVNERRTYTSLSQIASEVDGARIWGGLHYRHSMDDGKVLGVAVARQALATHFRVVAATPDPAATLPRTGPTAALPLTGVGLSLIGMGGALVVATIRRRSSRER
ncbi:MAG: vanadium-dependent haloperoxidase [Acidimicrobiia bacterium]